MGRVKEMKFSKVNMIGASALFLNSTFPTSAGAEEAGPDVLVNMSALAPSLWLAVPAVGLCMFGSWATARRLQNRKYRQSTRLLQRRFDKEIRLLDSAIDQHSIVSIADRNGNFIKVNKNFEDAFGYSNDDLAGQSISVLYETVEDGADMADVTGNADPQASFSEVHHAISSGKVWSGEQTLRRANGELIYVMSTVLPHFDDDGNHVQTVSLRSDITQKRTSEIQRQLTRMLDELQDEVFLYEVDTLNISYLNKSALARCDWTVEDVVGKTIADTSRGFSITAFRQHVAPLMDGSRDVVSIETRHEKGPVEVKTRIFTDPSGKKVFLSVLRDTSERKELQVVKMDTMARVSHELRTPLTSIKGALRLIQSGVAGKLTPELQGMIDIAARNSDRLLLMVDDILILEKMNANKAKFEMQKTNLKAFLQDAVSINQGFGDELGVRFVMDDVPGQPIISGNSDRLMQVMTNLMSNAAKYSPKGADVRVGIEDKDDNWRVYVTDFGPGVPESARATIFDSFTQFAAADGTTRSGTGLGLQICRKIVDLHDGRISFRSEPGKQTTFYFDLPKLSTPPDLVVVSTANQARSAQTGRSTEKSDLVRKA